MNIILKDTYQEPLGVSSPKKARKESLPKELGSLAKKRTWPDDKENGKPQPKKNPSGMVAQSFAAGYMCLIKVV